MFCGTNPSDAEARSQPLNSDAGGVHRVTLRASALMLQKSSRGNALGARQLSGRMRTAGIVPCGRRPSAFRRRAYELCNAIVGLPVGILEKTGSRHFH